MVAVALALACVALARPQVEGKRTVETRGLDVVVAGRIWNAVAVTHRVRRSSRCTAFKAA